MGGKWCVDGRMDGWMGGGLNLFARLNCSASLIQFHSDFGISHVPQSPSQSADFESNC